MTDMERLSRMLRQGIQGLAEVEGVTDGNTISVIGPLCLDDLADFLLTFAGVQVEADCNRDDFGVCQNRDHYELRA